MMLANRLLPLPSEACWIEAIGRLPQQIADVRLQDGLQQMRVDAEFGGDHAGDAGGHASPSPHGLR